MHNTAKFNVRNLGIGRRTAGIATTALLAALLSALAPTSASAFDVGGLIGTAIALQMGGGHYRAPSYRHSREHVASRHDRPSDGDNTDVERDARDVEAPAKVGSSQGGSSHQPAAVPHGITAQASERDVAAGQVAASDRSAGDAPAFTPSR